MVGMREPSRVDGWECASCNVADEGTLGAADLFIWLLLEDLF